MSKLDVFSSFQPLNLDLSKADDDKDTIEIEGIATTEHEDTAGEIILQDGLDWSYCLKNGSFNYDHSNEPKFIMGAPQSVKKLVHNGKPATSIKGVLYARKQIVQDLVENYKAMKSAGDIRQLGFSIEGQVLTRDNKAPHIITRARVLNVSLTHNPCNTEATVAMVKNILANIEKEEEMVKSEYDDQPMSYRQAEQLKEYSDKLCLLLDSMGEDADLPEWVQSKITKALDYVQSSYHYLESEDKKEKEELMDKAEIKYEDGESPESKAKKLLDIHPELGDEEIMAEIHRLLSKKYSDEEMDKMDSKQLIEYIRFLEGLKKEYMDYDSGCDDCEDCEGDCADCPKCRERMEMDKQTDYSPIQPESLEGGELASEGMNIGYEDGMVEDLDLEDQEDVLSREDLKALIIEMLKMGLPIEKILEKIKEYSK